MQDKKRFINSKRSGFFCYIKHNNDYITDIQVFGKRSIIWCISLNINNVDI